jgi:2'-5' RNA ligase
VRCFIGFFLPKEAKDFASDRQSRLSHAKFTWKKVEEENLHVNISFLGEVEETEVGRKADALESLCASHRPFSITVGPIRLIPSERRPRVVALDAMEMTGELRSLTSEVTRIVGGDSKPPHITLGRIRSVLDSDDLSKRVANLNKESSSAPSCSFQIGSIDLIRSELGQSGPSYTVIRSCKLG